MSGKFTAEAWGQDSRPTFGRLYKVIIVPGKVIPFMISKILFLIGVTSSKGNNLKDKSSDRIFFFFFCLLERRRHEAVKLAGERLEL